MAGEYPHLRALPPAPVPEYVSYTARVLKWSTIRVDSRTYSVPSRLIGVMVDVAAVPRPRRGVLQGAPGGEHGADTR